MNEVFILVCNLLFKVVFTSLSIGMNGQAYYVISNISSIFYEVKQSSKNGEFFNSTDIVQHKIQRSIKNLCILDRFCP